MLSKLQKLRTEKSEQGFTIIEVMIVLAIAGLIILIVLLAVPALQRNGRNAAIKQDAGAVVAGISESKSNNDGTPPTNVAGIGTVAITNTISTNAKVQGGTAVSYVPSTGSAPASTGPAAGTIVVLAGHKCDAAGTFTAGTTGDASARSMAVYYSVESAATLNQKCVEA